MILVSLAGLACFSNNLSDLASFINRLFPARLVAAINRRLYRTHRSGGLQTHLVEFLRFGKSWPNLLQQAYSSAAAGPRISSLHIHGLRKLRSHTMAHENAKQSFCGAGGRDVIECRETNLDYYVSVSRKNVKASMLMGFGTLIP